MVGSTVGNYQILEKLGAGGMGDIYKAQDPRLNRMVAIKVLSLASAGDPERRRRFVQEAQAASGLNHPNIVTIYDIISQGDNEYMVMEFISGKTLVDVIPKGGLRLPQALKYSVQIADALSVAHLAGIVHRDLKPANVMITDSGLVKILDFGLAKLTDRGPVDTGGDATQTIGAAPLTVEGSIIGTLSYMSPEQAQGKKVDARSDVFSFGLLLYEMVTGVRAFSGDNALETLSAILRDEARPIAEIAPDCPPQIEQVVHRTLRKNPDDRWQSMNEVRSALTALMRESDSGTLYRLTGSHTLPPIAPAPPKAQAPAKPKSIMLPMLLIAAGVLVVMGISVMMVLQRHRTQVAATAAQAAAEAAKAAEQAAAAPPPADATPPPESNPASDASVLNNDQIIDMVANKVPTAVILSQIHSSKTDFNLTAPEIIKLNNAGVSSKIIEAMRHPDAIPASVPPPSRTASTSSPAAAQTPPPVIATPAPVVTPVTPPPATTASATPAPPKPAENKAPEKWIEITVTDATPIPVTLAADVPADAPEGQPIKLTASRELRVGDNVVIAKGAAVTADIAEAAKKKFIGSGKTTFKVTKIASADGKTLNVRATPGKSTEGPARRPVEVPNQKHVKELAAAAGAEYIVYIDGAQTLSIKK